MNQGAIETMEPARDVFRRPATPFVARFFGLNVLEATLIGRIEGTPYVEVALGHHLTTRAPAGSGMEASVGDAVLACIRKEHVRVEQAPMPDSHMGTIEAASFLGVAEEYIVKIDEVAIRATRPAAGFARGDKEHVGMSPDDWIVLQTGETA